MSNLATGPELRPWHRLSLRVGALFVASTFVAVGLVAVVLYEYQKEEIEETLGTLLVSVARTGALLIDPALDLGGKTDLPSGSEAYERVQTALGAILDATHLDARIYTLTHVDLTARQAVFTMAGDPSGTVAAPAALDPELIAPLTGVLRDGIATHTPPYRDQQGRWITAFAPVRDRSGRIIEAIAVELRVGPYMRRREMFLRSVVGLAIAGALGALIVGLVLTRRITRPISALTAATRRVAAGDLSQPLPIRSADEIGQLMRAFNAMLDGLRQRDFIRDAFGRYVSPEVARALLDSPEGLRLGGEKREITVLMADLRGYTGFAERGDAPAVMAVLNEYLAAMAKSVIHYGGTVNEFLGDAVFALFGAPVAYADHAERAAAAALAMQLAILQINRRHAARGLPQLEMGIGINSGEVVVGNIGSEQRAKYAAVGRTVNLTARIEAAAVGGQVLVSAAAYERIREIAQVGAPIALQLKGIGEPCLVYELHGLRGPHAHLSAAPPSRHATGVEVALPLKCWMVEGHAVGHEAISGVVLRLGTRQVEARLDVRLPVLSEVRLRLSYPDLGHDSRDLYGTVVTEEEHAGTRMTWIRLTSVEPIDAQILEDFVTSGLHP